MLNNESRRDRTISLKLSDDDCEKLMLKCGEYGIGLGELFENFIGDLVDGTFSNGADERMYAQKWFDRCFRPFKEPTLLSHLIGWGYDPEEYLNTLAALEKYKTDKDYFSKYPEEADDQAQFLDDEISDLEDELQDMRTNWKPGKEPDMESEIELINNWVSEKEELFKTTTSVLTHFDEEAFINSIRAEARKEGQEEGRKQVEQALKFK